MYTRHFARHVFASILCAALVAAFPATSSAQAPTTTYTVLYLAEQTGGISFPGGEADAQGRDGNTYFGARGNPDTLFYITPGGTTNIVYSVGFGAASGATLGTDGNFYGTNVDGGPGGNCGFAGCGQVYQITPAGVETILHNFTGFADGAALYDAPIEGKAGKFYGTTPISNGQGISTAFSVTSSGTFTTLHDFTTAEGYPIYAGLVQGTDGNL